MRLVTVKAPEGHGRGIAEIAFLNEIGRVTVRKEVQVTTGHQEKNVDVVEFETATPKAKGFIESLMESPDYNPDQYSFSVRHPEAIFATEPPQKETYPIIRPTTDVYQELWQFHRVTISLVGRVFLSSILIAYGMKKNYLPLIIAGLLFLPYHHQMLSIGLGTVLREWRFLTHGLLALLTSTIVITLAGVCVALFMEPPIKFEMPDSRLAGVVLAGVIGTAAALGAIDDAGRRELIGLAATAHLSIYPVYIGMELVFGTLDVTKFIHHLLSFGINLITLITAATITFLLLRMKGSGIRRFTKQKSGTA